MYLKFLCIIFLVTENGEYLGFEGFGVGRLTQTYKTNSRETPAPSQFSSENSHRTGSKTVHQARKQTNKQNNNNNNNNNNKKVGGFFSNHCIIDSSKPQGARSQIISEYWEARLFFFFCRPHVAEKPFPPFWLNNCLLSSRKKQIACLLQPIQTSIELLGLTLRGLDRFKYMYIYNDTGRNQWLLALLVRGLEWNLSDCNVLTKIGTAHGPAITRGSQSQWNVFQM